MYKIYMYKNKTPTFRQCVLKCESIRELLCNATSDMKWCELKKFNELLYKSIEIRWINNIRSMLSFYILIKKLKYQSKFHRLLYCKHYLQLAPPPPSNLYSLFSVYSEIKNGKFPVGYLRLSTPSPWTFPTPIVFGVAAHSGALLESINSP